jgi:hypothetical protein
MIVWQIALRVKIASPVWRFVGGTPTKRRGDGDPLERQNFQQFRHGGYLIGLGSSLRTESPCSRSDIMLDGFLVLSQSRLSTATTE